MLREGISLFCERYYGLVSLNTNLFVDKTGPQAKSSRTPFLVFVCFNMVMAFCMHVNDYIDSVLVERPKSVGIEVDYFFDTGSNKK